MYALTKGHQSEAKSYSELKMKQHLRWIASSLSLILDSQEEIQCYYDEDERTIYVASNTIKNIAHLRDKMERFLQGLDSINQNRVKARKNMVRKKRHLVELKNYLRVNGIRFQWEEETAKIVLDGSASAVSSSSAPAVSDGSAPALSSSSAPASSSSSATTSSSISEPGSDTVSCEAATPDQIIKIQLVDEGTKAEDGLHAERRLHRFLAWKNGKTVEEFFLKPENLGGLRRPCAACHGLCFENPDQIHSGPLWPSQAALMNITEKQLNRLKEQLVRQETYVTKVKVKKGNELHEGVTDAYDTDSENESNQAETEGKDEQGEKRVNSGQNMYEQPKKKKKREKIQTQQSDEVTEDEDESE